VIALALSVRRALNAVRRSMTAQVSLAIALVSVTIILVFGSVLDRFIEHELREDNELLLLSSLAFVRDDIVAAGGDAAAVPGAIGRISRRARWLHAAVYDERGALVAKSAGDILPRQAFPALPLAIDGLPRDADMTLLERVRPSVPLETRMWVAPNGLHFRLALGRVQLPAQALTIALGVETSATRRLRMQAWTNIEIALAAAALLASLVGIWVARRILASARRFGATATRINAQTLQERLQMEDTPTELIESAVAFNHMLDRLQGAIDRLSSFSSELAHDLRTPIGNLLGEAQVALSRPRSAEEYRAVLESAVEEYERISRMTANMLFLARADDHNAIAPHWVDLEGTLARVMGYFELLAEERGIFLSIRMDWPSQVPRRVWADETMIVRALSNLVSNALRHATRGTPVVLSAQAGTDGTCAVHVANDGPSIAPEHQALIFERFYRVDASRRGSASGSGLGLAIVRSIMEMHHGRVSVTSAPGQPTIFTLHFPAPTGQHE
jgi:two-component system heavy metal sensor histidine kinase CusS